MAAGLEATDLGRRLLGAAAAPGCRPVTPSSAATRKVFGRPRSPSRRWYSPSWCWPAPSRESTEVVAVAGHSVGELSACAAAGALEPETALRLSVERGRLMAAMREGMMAAVLGLDARRRGGALRRWTGPWWWPISTGPVRW